MKRCSGGFSLIELMIVIAIISILASIAVPSYLRYVASTRVAAGKAEIGALTVNFEDALNGGKATPALSDISTRTATATCSFALTSNADGSATLACTLLTPPYLITGGVISYIRSSAGAWTCQVNASIGADYAPKGCTVGG